MHLFHAPSITSACAIVIGYQPSSEVLENIRLMTDQEIKVIYVDNSTSGESTQIIDLLATYPNVSVVRNMQNLGIAMALNQGIQKAKCAKFDWVFTFDQDSRVTPGFFEIMLSTFNEAQARFGRIAILSPYRQNRAGDRSLEFNHYDENGFEIQSAVMTSGNLHRLDLFDEVQGFDEGYFIDYVDFEFCLRTREMGFQVVQTNKAVLIHNIGNETRHAIFGKNPITTNHNYRRRYTITRNRIYTQLKYFHFDLRWVLNDIFKFYKETTILVLVESDRKRKLKSIYLGIRDVMLGRKGPYIYD